MPLPRVVVRRCACTRSMRRQADAWCTHDLGGEAVQLDIERKLRALLTKEKEKAEEEAALAMGLCTGGSMLS